MLNYTLTADDIVNHDDTGWHVDHIVVDDDAGDHLRIRIEFGYCATKSDVCAYRTEMSR